MIDNIALLGSGLNTDDDITTIPNGDSRHRFNVVYGSDGDYGSLVGIKDSVSVPLLSEWSTWTNKMCIGAVEYIHGNSFIFLLYGETVNLGTTTKHVVIAEVKSNNSIEVIGELPTSMLSQYTQDTTIEPYIIDKFLGFTDKINEPILINIERAKLYIQHNPVPYYNPITVYNTGSKVYFKGYGLYSYTGTSSAGMDVETHPDKWSFIGDMYEALDYESIIRYRRPSLSEPSCALGYSKSITDNRITKNQFQFATRSIYKDSQISVLSPYSPVIYSGTIEADVEGSPNLIYNSIEANKINITIQPQPAEVKKIELLCRTQDGLWVIVDTFVNKGVVITSVFTNSSVYAGVDAAEAIRPFDYISNKVDASASIGGRIVDGGLNDGRNMPNINVDYNLKFSNIKNIPTDGSAGDDSWTCVQTGSENGNKFVSHTFNISINNTVNNYVFKGGNFISNYFSHAVASGGSIVDGDPYTIAVFYYNIAYGDTIQKIVDFINDYKPVFTTNRTGEFAIGDVTATYVDLNNFTLKYKLLYTGTINKPISSISNQTNPIAYSYLQEPIVNNVLSLKSSSDIYVGIELSDKNGVFYPVNKVTRIQVPSKYYLRNNASNYGVVFNVDERTVYKTELQAEIKDQLPEWCDSYRFVYFGSSFDYFVQNPTHKIFGDTKNKVGIENTVWETYESKNTFLNNTFYENRKSSIDVSSKSVFTIAVGDYLSNINSIEGVPSTTILGSEFRKIVDMRDVRGVNFLKLDIPFAGQDYLKLTNNTSILEVRNTALVQTTIGKTCSNTFDSALINQKVDVGLSTCVIRNAYKSKTNPEKGLNINCSVEDMIYADNYFSTVKPEGRVNTYLSEIKNKHLEGKLRNGGNYIDNTQINNLCRFDVLDYNNVDDQWGKITQMYPVGQNLRVRQERNYSTVYIGSIQSVSPDGTTQTLQSSKFLGSVYAADAGIGSKYGGYYTIGTQEFTFDDATKNIYRTSQGGIYSISGKAFTQEGANDYKIHKLITDISLNNATRHINFGYDNENDLLLATFIGTEKKTIGFHIPTQRWLSFYGFTPERYISSGINNYYFSGGALFQMNKGLKLPIEYDFTTNVEPTTSKKFRSMAIVGDIANFICECTIPSGSNYRDMYTRTTKIVSKENKKYIEIPRNMKTSSNTPSVMEKETGIEMRGYAMNVKMTGDLKLTSINVNAD